MAHMLSLSLYTPVTLAKELGQRTARLRLQQNWKRATLAERSGVSTASLKRFETTGQISLENLLKVALALGRLDQFETLFEPLPARSFAELDRVTTSKRRKRGTA